MKKAVKTLALALIFALALSTFVFADVAAAPMFITIGLIFLLIAAVIIIAIALIIKLVGRLMKSRNDK